MYSYALRLAAALLIASWPSGAQTPSPSRQIQLQQERAARQSAEELRRGIAREQRERVEREHAEERLLQRRAEAERQTPVPDVEMRRNPAAPPRKTAEAQPVVPVQPVRGPDFSPGLMARSLGVGLLAAAAVFLLGRLVERRFLHG